MKLAIGIDVHKTSCTAHAAYAGMGRPRQWHLDYIETFNEDFRKFHSDCRGMMELHNRIKEHDVHILIENSTKSHDIYWMLKGLGHEIAVAHATDLKRITESHRKNDYNDACELAHYMRRRLMGENVTISFRTRRGRTQNRHSTRAYAGHRDNCRKGRENKLAIRKGWRTPDGQAHAFSAHISAIAMQLFISNRWNNSRRPLQINGIKQ